MRISRVYHRSCGIAYEDRENHSADKHELLNDRKEDNVASSASASELLLRTEERSSKVIVKTRLLHPTLLLATRMIRRADYIGIN